MGQDGDPWALNGKERLLIPIPMLLMAVGYSLCYPNHVGRVFGMPAPIGYAAALAGYCGLVYWFWRRSLRKP